MDDLAFPENLTGVKIPIRDKAVIWFQKISKRLVLILILFAFLIGMLGMAFYAFGNYDLLKITSAQGPNERLVRNRMGNASGSCTNCTDYDLNFALIVSLAVFGLAFLIGCKYILDQIEKENLGGSLFDPENKKQLILACLELPWRKISRLGLVDNEVYAFTAYIRENPNRLFLPENQILSEVRGGIARLIEKFENLKVDLKEREIKNAKDEKEKKEQANIDANVPSDEVFGSLLKAAVAKHFKYPEDSFYLEYKFLKNGPSRSANSFPKFYLWIRISGKNNLFNAGALRVASVKGEIIQVLNFMDKNEIVKNTNNLHQTFPIEICASILENARNL